MKSRVRWSILIAGVCAAAGWLVSVVAKPPAASPIVLSYHEGPIFLRQHEHWVTALAFSPDGKTLVSGADDSCIRLWDASTGKLRSLLADDSTRGIHGLAFSPDGARLAVAGGLFGKEAIVWDVAAGQIAQQFEEQLDPQAAAAAPFVYKGKPISYRISSAAAYSPDGRLLALAGDGVIVRDAQSGDLITTLKQPAKGVKALAFSPDGKTLVTAADDKKVRLWNMPAGRLEKTLDGATQPLAAVAISADGKRIVATGSGNRSILSRDATPVGYLWSWDASDGAPRKVELGETQVRRLAFAGPTRVLIAAGTELLSVDLQNSDLQNSDLQNSDLQNSDSKPQQVWSHRQDILALAVSADGRLAATGAMDRTVDVVDIAAGKLVYRLPGLSDVVSAVAASSDGRWFATATLDARFSTRVPTKETSFAARHEKYFSGETNASRCQAGEVRIWSPDSGQLHAVLPLPASQVTAIGFLSQGQLAVGGWLPGKGGMLSLWDAASGKHVRDFAVGAAEVLSIAVSPAGQTLASGDAAGNLDVWDAATGKQLRTQKHTVAIEALAFSSDGKRLAVGDGQQTVQILDAATGKVQRTLQSRSYVESLEFSPDANLLAAGTRGPGLELWDLRVGDASRTLKAPGDHFEPMPGFVAFSPDGQLIVCGGHGKDVAVFEAATGTLRHELSGHYHAVNAATFLPDGRLLSGSEERTTRLWDAKANKLLATWVAYPAEPSQGWTDEWVGFVPSGPFVGSANLDRLLGWQAGGKVQLGAEAGSRRRVENLFATESDKAPDSQ